MAWFIPFSRFFSSSVRSAVAVALLPVWLTGCALLQEPSAPDAQPGPASAEALRRFHPAIDIAGRLSVRYQQNGAEQSVHGSFTWAQSPDRSTVTLLSPLGQIMAMITVTPGASTLIMGGKTRTATDVDTLAEEALGWPLPVAGLRDWLQGFALDSQGRRFIAAPPASSSLTTLDGWRLTYAAWRDELDSSPKNAPRRIDLARGTAQAGNVEIRIVVDDWQPR